MLPSQLATSEMRLWCKRQDLARYDVGRAAGGVGMGKLMGVEQLFEGRHFDREALSRRLGTCDRLGGPVARRMKKIDYDGYRFPPVIIQQAIWLYFRFTLSFRDVEDLLAGA